MALNVERLRNDVKRLTVQADITTDRRRVIDFFLSPVVKYLDEAMKVR
jgi:hemolysin D